jgi:hypothetical protein
MDRARMRLPTTHIDLSSEMMQPGDIGVLVIPRWLVRNLGLASG